MSALNMEAKDVTYGLYVKAPERGELLVVCNWCGMDGPIFYEGRASKMPESDWLEKGITHLLTEHVERYS